MIRRPPRSTQSRSSAASDVYKRQVLGEALLDRRGERRIEARVRALRVERADALEERREEIRERLTGRGHALGEEETREEAVLLGHVAGHREAGGLLASERDLVREKELTDVLEADRRREDGGSIRLRHRVEPMRGGEGTRDPAGVALAAAAEEEAVSYTHL